MSRPSHKLIAAGAFCLLLGAAICPIARATTIVLKDGRSLQGKYGLVPGLAEAPLRDGIQLIRFIDDDLRRTFFSFRLILDVSEDNRGDILVKFHLDRQPVRRSGPQIVSVGIIVRIEDFDRYGRRILSMRTGSKQVDVIQAITEITPVWTKVEGVTHVWDMRIATSSIPRETLAAILATYTDASSIDDRKKIAQFYIQANRFNEATAALEALEADFPGQVDLSSPLQTLRQMAADLVLDELEFRRQGGQHAFALENLRAFPSEDIAREKLMEVRELIGKYEGDLARRQSLLETLDTLLAQVKDENIRKQSGPVLQEISSELNFNTLNRMAAFEQFAGDQSLLPEERLALAVSGWLIGSNSAIENMPVALSLFEVRNLVRQYLVTPQKLARDQIFERFSGQEGATPTFVTELLAHMRPPLELPDPIQDKPGYFEVEVPGPDAASVRYIVQVPPEYDPLRRYPTIVTLHGERKTPEQQLNWWAGQAARHGYIVIAPEWVREHQRSYGYTALEHAAVLHCLRDATRRFSVDTDRVFLNGHAMGGDAAWDIGLAHPDLWAGVIPIAGRSDRYCMFYKENAKLLPFYVVGGEKDGGWMANNARDLDRYLKRGYNTTVVEYRGRGREYFSDEIHHLFDWMGRYKRDFLPHEYEVYTMRPWDYFFYWLELWDLPPKTMVDPVDWPPGRGVKAAKCKAHITNNTIYVTTGADRVTVWLTPEMVDFDKPVSLTVNGRRVNMPLPERRGDDGGRGSGRNRFVEPDLEVILEDVRTRGDRQHPFWVKVES